LIYWVIVMFFSFVPLFNKIGVVSIGPFFA